MPLDAHGNSSKYNAWSGDDTDGDDGIYNFYLRVQALNDAPKIAFPKNKLSVYEDGGYFYGGQLIGNLAKYFAVDDIHETSAIL